MFGIFRKNIDVLKQRVRFNLEVINKNEKRIRDLLNEQVSKERAKKLEKLFEFNKSLLEENKDAINLQKSIIEFMEKHKIEMDDTFHLLTNTQELLQIENSLSKDDYFELTINKTLDFDKNHPCINDQEFINDLLDYFTLTEEYEMCSQILKSKEQSVFGS